MTAEEFGRKYAGQSVELIHGEVKENPMPGGKHGKVCYRVAMAIGAVVDSQNLGHVFTNDTFVHTPTRDDPEKVRGADVCFVSYDRLPREAEIPAGVLPVAPNLVAEVRSPTDTWAEVFLKVGEYLGAGVVAVLVFDSGTGTASVYRNDPANPQQICHTGDTLTIPDVLPGFAVEVKKFFE
jgi:Uma2 family endonuclease